MISHFSEKISEELFSELISASDSHELTQILIRAISKLFSPDVAAVVRISLNLPDLLVLGSSVDESVPVLTSRAVLELVTRSSQSAAPIVFESELHLAGLLSEGGDTKGISRGIAISLGEDSGSETVLVCLWREEASSFSVNEVGLLRSICVTAARIYEQKRILQEQRSIVSALQRGLLKVDYVEGNCEVATRYRPAIRELNVGGDWFDAVVLDDDHVGLIVGDVVGKGLMASTAMSQLRSALSAMAMVNDSPAEVLRRLDRFAGRIEGALASTVIYAKVELSTGVVKFTSAGHPPAVIIRANGEHEVLDKEQNWPLAVNRDDLREVSDVKLEVGDTLLMYTDGLVETRGDVIDKGIERLFDMASHYRNDPLEMFCDELLQDILDDQHRHDDAVLVAFRLLKESITRFHLEVEPLQLNLADTRGQLNDWLKGVGVEEGIRNDIVLASGEALSNCLEHSGITENGGLITIHATKDADAVNVCISDSGKWDSSPSEEGRGRGTYFIKSVMDYLHTETNASGTVVRMTKKF